MTFLLGTQNIQLLLKQMEVEAARKELRYDIWEDAVDREGEIGRTKNLCVIGVLRSFLRVIDGTLHPKTCLGKDENKTTKLSFSSLQPGVPEHISCQQENSCWHLQEELFCRERGSSQCRTVVVLGASEAPHP